MSGLALAPAPHRGRARHALAIGALLALLTALLLALPGRSARADSLPVSTPQTVHVVSYNICGSECPRLHPSADSPANRIADVLAQATTSGWNADAIFLQEVCRTQYDSLTSSLQPRGYHGLFSTTVAAGTSTTACGGTADYGMAVFVKGTVLDSYAIRLRSGGETEDIVSPCLKAAVDGRAVWACSVHLYWGSDPTPNQQEAAKLAAQAAAWEDSGTPVILGGDFNAGPRTTSLSDFYGTSANDGGHGRFLEADETDKDYFNTQVCDTARDLYCRSGETGFTGGSGALSKIDYLLFGERYFRDAQGDELPRDASVSDHQLYRGAVSFAGMSGTAAVGDLTGDGMPDLVAVERSTGDLYRYAGPGFTGGSRVRIGNGWDVYDTLLGVGDLTGDGVPDLLAEDGDGRLFRYSGPGFTGGSKVQIGSGWQNMAGVSAVGDLTGDGVPDLVAVERSTGDLYRYAGPGFTGGSRVRIGNGWDVYHTLIGAGDQTGDGVSDLLGVDAGGQLFRYAGPGYPGGSRTQVGVAWNSMAGLTAVGDLTGDGVPDLLAVEAASGKLYRYSGPGFAGGSRVQIGTGW